MSNPPRPLVASSTLIQVAGADPISLTILGLPKSIRDQHDKYDNKNNNNKNNKNNNDLNFIHPPLILTSWPKQRIQEIRADEVMEQELHRNLDSKTIILSRLMHEANEQAKEIATNAEDISSIRSENLSIEKQLIHLQNVVGDTRKIHVSRKEEMKIRQKEAAEQAKIASGQEEQSLAKIKGLQAGIVELQIKQKEMLVECQKLNRLIQENPNKPRRNAWAKRMEAAIRVQQLYITRMKQENNEIINLQERAERTERIILMMEKKLYAANSQDEKTIAMHPRVKYRIRDLQEQVMEAADRERALHMVLSGEDDGLAKKMNRSKLLDGENTKIEKKNGEQKQQWDNFQKGSDSGGGGGGDGGKSAEVWQLRCTKLQEQLITNAKSFAGELSKVKLDLMQAQLGGGSDSDSDG